MPLAPDYNSESRQSWVATTNATATTINEIPIPSGATYSIGGYISAVRTGGSAGSAGDSAGYRFFGTYKNVAGTVSQVGLDLVSQEDQTAWDVTASISGTIVRIQVTGATNNNINWMTFFDIVKATP